MDPKKMFDAYDAARAQELACPSPDNDELTLVRDDISRVALVASATRPIWGTTANGERFVDGGDPDEHWKQVELLRGLLAKEREILAGMMS